MNLVVNYSHNLNAAIAQPLKVSFHHFSISGYYIAALWRVVPLAVWIILCSKAPSFPTPLDVNLIILILVAWRKGTFGNSGICIWTKNYLVVLLYSQIRSLWKPFVTNLNLAEPLVHRSFQPRRKILATLWKKLSNVVGDPKISMDCCIALHFLWFKVRLCVSFNTFKIHYDIEKEEVVVIGASSHPQRSPLVVLWVLLTPHLLTLTTSNNDLQ